MKPDPLVSVIINNHNYGRFLHKAIDTALAQDYSPLEVIVVDDGSTDESSDIIRSYGNRIIPVFKANGGQASAFNQGFAACNGEIICLEDADDYFLPAKVRTIVCAFADNPPAQWCYHPVRWVGLDDRPIETYRKPVYTTRMLDLRPHIASGRVQFTAPPTSGLTFRRSLLGRILPMPERIEITSDNYVKFASFTLAPGLILDAELACQRIHDSNAFTRKTGFVKERTHARVKLLTAHALQDRFPAAQKFSDRLFASSLASYWVHGGIDRAHSNVVRDYLRHATFASKCRVAAKAIIYLARMRVSTL